MAGFCTCNIGTILKKSRYSFYLILFSLANLKMGFKMRYLQILYNLNIDIKAKKGFKKIIIIYTL